MDLINNKTKKIKSLTLCLLLVSLPVFSQNMDKEYTEQVRSNATTFHKNFTTGDFDKNGPLVNEKIYVNSNNAIVIGRDNFVQRIKRFSIPFPTLALRDKVILVDGNEVGLLYVMQGTQNGPYGPISASGNKKMSMPQSFLQWMKMPK